MLLVLNRFSCTFDFADTVAMEPRTCKATPASPPFLLTVVAAPSQTASTYRTLPPRDFDSFAISLLGQFDLPVLFENLLWQRKVSKPEFTTWLHSLL